MDHPQVKIVNAPCQFANMSKTKASFEFMKQEVNSEYDFGLNFFLTNNNLVETEQILARSIKENFRPITMSSNKQTTSNICLKDLELTFFKASCPEDLPNTIICCNNSKQMKSIVAFIKTITEFENTSIGEIRINIYVDEIDANTTITGKLYKQLEPYYSSIESIILITATMFEKTQKWFKKTFNVDEFRCKNLYSEIEYTPSMRDMNVEEYRKLIDHNVTFISDEYVDENQKLRNLKEDKYIEKVLLKHPESFETGGVRRVIVLAGRRTQSHYSVQQLFQQRGYISLIMNSKVKGGEIHYPDGKTTNFVDFKTENFGTTKVEVYDILAKLYELNPKTSSVIIGNLNVNRGVTFMSTGSQLTDLIMSDCGSNELKRQFTGRFNGHKKYVADSNMYMPQSTYGAMIKYEHRSLETHKENPKVLTDIHCVDKELDDTYYIDERKTIPQSFQLTDEEFEIVSAKNSSRYFKNKKYILDYILENYDYKINKIPEKIFSELAHTDLYLMIGKKPQLKWFYNSIEENNAIRDLANQHMKKDTLIMSVVLDKNTKKVVLIAYKGYQL